MFTIKIVNDESVKELQELKKKYKSKETECNELSFLNRIYQDKIEKLELSNNKLLDTGIALIIGKNNLEEQLKYTM